MEWASRNGGEHIRSRSCGGTLSPSHAVSVGCSVDFSLHRIWKLWVLGGWASEPAILSTQLYHLFHWCITLSASTW